MEIKEGTQINDAFINQLVEQIRQLLSQTLNIYLQLYKDFDHAKARAKEEKSDTYYYQNSQLYNDKDGKINWEVIRKILPSNLERIIQEQFDCLHENERKLLVLFFLKFSHKNISSILPYTRDSILTLKGRIKAKTGVNSIDDIFRKIALNLLLNKDR